MKVGATKTLISFKNIKNNLWYQTSSELIFSGVGVKMQNELKLPEEE